MRLYLEGKSKNKIGYTPDWIRLAYEEDNKYCEITFDIFGDIDYSPRKLSCRCKGKLEPWVLWMGDEEEINFEERPDFRELYTLQKIKEIFDKATDFCVGIYPCSEDDDDEIWSLADNDELTGCKGVLSLCISEDDNCYEKEFEFEVERNW